MPRRATEQNINTYRVLYEEAYNWPAPKKPFVQQECQTELRKSNECGKKNLKSKFLYGNTATLNKPVPIVITCSPSGKIIDDSEWFYHHGIEKLDNGEQCAPQTKTADEMTPKSTTQDSYNERAFFLHERRPLCKREHFTEGIVPVTHALSKDEKQRVWNEKISFEHIYDARRANNYPTRGRRQGAFVWERASPKVEELVLKQISESVSNEANNNMMTEGAAAMQGWADGLAKPSEHMANHRQFAISKYPVKQIEQLQQTDTVATLMQPELYKSSKTKPAPVPLFTR